MTQGNFFFLILALVFTACLLSIFLFNQAIKYRNETVKALAQIDSLYQQRWDLLPKIVETTMNYAAHERTTLTEVMAARASALRNNDETQNLLFMDLVAKVYAVSESYPNLKADNIFLELSREISDCERRLNLSRMYYNESAKIYNDFIQTIPMNFFAKILSFGEAPYLSSSPETKQSSPKIPEPHRLGLKRVDE